MNRTIRSGGHYRRGYLNATVRLIGWKHGEPSPSVSIIYQIRAVGAKGRSYQAQSRFAWMKSIRTFRGKTSENLA